MYQRLGDGGSLDNYIDDINTLPLRIMLTTSGLPFDEQTLANMYRAGFNFIKVP